MIKNQSEINELLFRRNDKGLFSEQEYVFNDDQSINWRKMVKHEYLVPNKQKTTETDVSLLKDNELIIRLIGLKHLAALRGYKSVTYTVKTATPSYVCVACKITWEANYETGFKEIEFESIADASLENTNDFARFYLAATAENRAFARCIRNFLKIDIVSDEEMASKQVEAQDTSSNSESSSDPLVMLEKILKDKNMNVDDVKKLLKEKGMEDKKLDKIKELSDVPKLQIFNLLSYLKD